MQKIKKHKNIIQLAKKWGSIGTFMSITLEMIFFPSLANLFGCISFWLIWLVYKNFFLKESIIVSHPFSFLAFLTIFLSSYLALPATLLEGKPVSFNMQIPLYTFPMDTLMFFIISLAFKIAINTKKKSNNSIQKVLFRLSFFKTNAFVLWILGLIGTFAKIKNLTMSQIDYSGVSNRFLAGFMFLQFAPLILLFPKLTNVTISKSSKRGLWVYIIFTFLLSFAANSRQQMIAPIITLMLLFFLILVKENLPLFKIITPYRFLFIGLFFLFGINMLTDVSVAMIYNRKSRHSISKIELLENTFETLQDDRLMYSLKNLQKSDHINVSNYSSGWSEYYVDNFMLNRYTNMHLVDRTLYYANTIGYGNDEMRNNFYEKFLFIFPTPILNLFNISFDKSKINYSAGDFLYFIATRDGYALGGYRITSLLADTLGVFSYFGFFIVFLLFFLAFRLLDCLIFYHKKGVIYSTLGLIKIFFFMGMFRHAQGLSSLLSYVLRGFWQDIFIYALLIIPLGWFSKIVLKK